MRAVGVAERGDIEVIRRRGTWRSEPASNFDSALAIIAWPGARIRRQVRGRLEKGGSRGGTTAPDLARSPTFPARRPLSGWGR